MKTKMITIVLILLSAVSLTTTSMLAEKKVDVLTLDKAIEIALDANINLKQVANQVKTEQISVKQNKANFYPDLSLSAMSSESFGKEYDLTTGTYNKKNSRNLSLSLSSNINLFNGFYDTAMLRQSKFDLKAKEENFSRSRQSVIYDTIQRFFQVVTAEEAVKVEKENLEAQRLQLIRIDEFCKAGRRPQADLYQQKAEIAAAEYRILNAERNYEVSKLLLKQTLGQEADTDYNVQSPDVDKLLEQAETFTGKNFLTKALELRPDVTAGKMQVEAAKKGVKASQSGYWPTLSLFADVGTNYSSRIEYSGFSDQLLDGNISGSVGLSLSVPIFDKNRTKNNVAAAKINLSNQQLALEKLEQQVGVEVRQAIEDFRTARKQLEVTAAQLKYTQAALESVRERYNVNAATMVELTQSRSSHLEAQLSRVEAKFNLLVRRIAIAFYEGDTETMLSLLD
jgi:outer membrane protein